MNPTRLTISSAFCFSRRLLLLIILTLFQPLAAARHDPDSRAGDGTTPPLRVIPADTLEPNDSPAGASLLFWDAGGEIFTGAATITSGLDFDFYAVELVVGDSLLARIKAPDGAELTLDPSLSIMDSAGTVLTGDLLSPGEASVAASYSGKYLVLVTDRSLLNGLPFSGELRGYELHLSRLLRAGDVDGSGVLDYRDAFIVFMLTSGLLDPSGVEPRVLAAADVDGDGTVTGDMDDFNILMDRVAYIPSRDPLAGGKQKNGGGGTTLLALADGSAVALDGHGRLNVVVAGEDAATALTVWDSLNAAPAQLPAAPDGFELKPASPNPFNPSTTISFSVQYETNVTLTVHDVRGRIVRTLLRGRCQAGNHSVHWAGDDSRGRAVASGVYFTRMAAEGLILTRKLVLLK